MPRVHRRRRRIGPDVSTVDVGDFVIAPFALSNSVCRNCESGFHTACIHGGFFGGGRRRRRPTEFVRVPHADGTLVAVPGAGFSDETMASLFALTDVMSTGYHAAVSAGVEQGATVAVVGDGAVGLSGALSRQMFGAEQIIVFASTHEDRHHLASEWGATGHQRSRQRRDKGAARSDRGYGADAVLECVGTKATSRRHSPSHDPAQSSDESGCHTASISTSWAPSTATSASAGAPPRSALPARAAAGGARRPDRPWEGLRTHHGPRPHRRRLHRHGRAPGDQGIDQGQ